VECLKTQDTRTEQRANISPDLVIPGDFSPSSLSAINLLSSTDFALGFFFSKHFSILFSCENLFFFVLIAGKTRFHRSAQSPKDLCKQRFSDELRFGYVTTTSNLFARAGS
jgi:hypothetical protein